MSLREQSCIEKSIEAAIEKQVRTVGACAHNCARASAFSLRVACRTNIQYSDDHREDEEQVVPRRNPCAETKFLERATGTHSIRLQGMMVAAIDVKRIINDKLSQSFKS